MCLIVVRWHMAGSPTPFVERRRSRLRQAGRRPCRGRARQGVADKVARAFSACAGRKCSILLFDRMIHTLERSAKRDHVSIGTQKGPPIPNPAEVYRDRVARLPEAFNAGRDGAAVLEQVRGLIDRVVVHPARDGGGPEIELIGEITSMIDLALGRHDVHDRRHGGDDRDLFCRSVKVVAGIGFEPMTFRL
jgi:site-specific DNA recombinase